MPSAVEGCFDDVLEEVSESCGGHLLDQGSRAVSGRRVASSLRLRAVIRNDCGWGYHVL